VFVLPARSRFCEPEAGAIVRFHTSGSGVRIGIVCYASIGGSGIVATELAVALAQHGDEVHLLSTEPPFRLRDDFRGVTFHAVETPAYPLFREPQYVLSLSSTIVQVCRTRALDVLHAHYAVPHAAAAYLARQILAADGRSPVPRVVTTLHGTDITVVGSDPSYVETVAFCIDQSDAVTAVSESLRHDTVAALGVKRPIVVIPNFLDCHLYRRQFNAALRARHMPEGCDVLVIHVSNFRPVKRVDLVVEVFRRIARHVHAGLLLVGDGPDVPLALERAREAGLDSRVRWLGEQADLVSLLSIADLFLLPSERESFGLAALEAMACEAPVIASRVGGLPEVIEHEVNGFLHPLEDVESMARTAVALLTDVQLRERVANAARRTVEERFCTHAIVPMYQGLYRELVESVTDVGVGHQPGPKRI
jgi:L-malate glycosyltransferase